MLTKKPAVSKFYKKSLYRKSDFGLLLRSRIVMCGELISVDYDMECGERQLLLGMLASCCYYLHAVVDCWLSCFDGTNIRRLDDLL